MKAFAKVAALLGCAMLVVGVLAACDQELNNNDERVATQGGFVLPEAVVASYNLDGTEDELKIVGKGAYVDDNTFGTGKVFKNDGTAKRTSYLLLPEDLLTHSSTSKEMTIGFWLKTPSGSTDFFHAPVFACYAAAPVKDKNNQLENTWPMFRMSAKGVLQINNAGICNFTDAENTSGKNVESTKYLDDNDWHYYACTLTETTVIIYIDGEIANSWTIDGTDGKNVAGLFSNGGDLKYNCLGGNQSWDWGDNDSPFLYAKFTVWNVALTGSQVKAMYDVR